MVINYRPKIELYLIHIPKTHKMYNQEEIDNISDNLPISLTHLELGYYYNQPLDNLPNSLTHLILGFWYNQLLDHLPSNVTDLTLGTKYDQRLDNLPKSLNIKYNKVSCP